MAADKQLISVIATILLELDSDNDLFASSSSDDELNEDLLLEVAKKTRVIPRTKDYAEKIIPLFSPSDFKSHFRMEPSTFDYIENKISRSIENCSGLGRTTVSSRKQILMILWLLATSESYRSISDRFNVSKSTLWTSFYRVCKEISSLSSSEIKWPTITEMKSIANGFKSISSFPNVIGCIDGSHIPIIAPVTHPVSYINRKGFHSVILQGVVNNRCLFTDCYAGEPGSVHDARVFRHSLLGRELQNKVPPEMHILGDSAYPLSDSLLTPFRDNGHLTTMQIKYNNCLSKTRSTVERAFALLKGRFRRLKYLDMKRVDLIPVVIISCCVMHNICQAKRDELTVETCQITSLCQDEVEIHFHESESANGNLNINDKRNEIMRLL